MCVHAVGVGVADHDAGWWEQTLAVYGRHLADLTAQRDRSIVAAHRAGLSYRRIGDAVGLSHTTVAAIVNRADG
jgi:DNA-binding NarL/FixJ family response regulator